MGKLNSLLGSRRFWVAAGGVAFVLLKEKFPNLTMDQVIGAAVIIGSWIYGESVRSSESPAPLPKV